MYLLFDIGGTNMRLAISRNGKTFEKPKVVSTPQNFKHGIDIFVKTAKELTGFDKIKYIAGGIAGPLDFKKEKLVGAPNLSQWNNKPFSNELQKKLNAPVRIVNDAELIGLGEATLGAGKGKNIVAYITVSTGIGGARIVNGKIDSNFLGFEPGHQIINIDNGKACDLEYYIGGNNIKKRYGKSVKDINDKKIWRQINEYLAYGLHNVVVFWSPEVIVLGGGMMSNSHIDLDYIEKKLKKSIKKFPKIPLIKKSKLKDFGGLYGAIEITKSIADEEAKLPV